MITTPPAFRLADHRLRGGNLEGSCTDPPRGPVPPRQAGSGEVGPTAETTGPAGDSSTLGVLTAQPVEVNDSQAASIATDGKPRSERARPSHHVTWTHRRRPGRTLAIVDAENLLGRARFDPYGVACGLAVSLAVVAELEDDDHIVVGSDVTIGHAIGLAFPGRRLVVGRGGDGADNALLAAVGSTSFVSDRFDRVVLASGDHIFAPLVRRLVRAGVEVWVVARPAALSRALACEASSVRFFAPDVPELAA